MNNRLNFKKSTLLIILLPLVTLFALIFLTNKNISPEKIVAKHDEKLKNSFYLEKPKEDKSTIEILEVEPSKDNMTTDSESNTVPSE